MRHFIAFAVIVTGSILSAQGVPEQRTKLETKLAKEEAYMERLKTSIVRKGASGLAPDDPKKPVAFPSLEVKNRRIKQQEMSIQQTRRLLRELAGKVDEEPDLAYPPRVGDVGRIPSSDGQILVTQVLKTGIVVNAFFTETILDGSNNRVTKRDEVRKVPLYVTGISTEGAAARLPLYLPQTFKITGTQTFKTARGGSWTILKLEPLTNPKK